MNKAWQGYYLYLFYGLGHREGAIWDLLRTSGRQARGFSVLDLQPLWVLNVSTRSELYGMTLLLYWGSQCLTLGGEAHKSLCVT